MDANEIRYTPINGLEPMRRAAQAKFERDNCLHYGLDQLTVGSGTKQVLFNAIMASVNPGDEVIIPTPYWGVYSDIVRIAGGVPVMLPCGQSEGFRLTPAQLEEAITPRTRDRLGGACQRQRAGLFARINFW